MNRMTLFVLGTILLIVLGMAWLRDNKFTEPNSHALSKEEQHSSEKNQLPSGESISEFDDGSSEESKEEKFFWNATGGLDPKPGMVPVKKAFETALKKASWRSSFDSNQPPDIALVTNRYVVTFWQRQDPYRSPVKEYDSKVEIDAWTGEYIEMELSMGAGAMLYPFSTDVGNGSLSEEERKAYSQRVADCLEFLNKKAREEGILPQGENPSADMVSPQEAIRVAETKVADRKYDSNQSPQAVLVGEIYIVIFWEDPDSVTPGWLLYDSRVGINAKTGEYIAMEITR